MNQHDAKNANNTSFKKQFLRMKTIIVLLLLPFWLSAQVVTLRQCHEMGRAHHPNLQKLALYESLTKINLENIQTKHLPTLDLTGSISYQSDVTGLSMPGNALGLQFPTISKDWYKAYVDVKQNLYDGGAVRVGKTLLKSEQETNLSQVEVSIYQVKQMINAAFFSTLYFQNTIATLELKQQVLNEQSQLAKSAVSNGVRLPNELDNLSAEIILNQQQITKLQTQVKNTLLTLSILTGNDFTIQTELKLPDIAIDTFQVELANRPEIRFFSAQKHQLEVAKDLEHIKRMPKAFGFAQVGYGRPGLNMLDDSFTDWYMVGVGLKWNIWDWKESRRNQQTHSIQQNLIQTTQNEFERSQTLKLLSELNNISQFESLIASDQELYNLRKTIADRSSSQLKHGVITSADFIRDLNNAMSAKLTMESRNIELVWAKLNFMFLAGLDVEN